MEKRIYKKEFIELIIECTEKRIARGDVAPEEAIKDAQYFIDSYNRYPYAYLGEEGDISIARGML